MSTHVVNSSLGHQGAQPHATSRVAAVALSQSVQTEAGLWSILQDIDLEIAQGEQVAITGRSGSGKSTLLGLLAGLDRASSGEVWLCGQPLHTLDEDERSAIRLAHVGFVFQSFQLLAHLTALENVMLPLTLGGGMRRSQAETLARDLLAQVGLAARMQQTPRVLSGGEQQRVAIARALVNRPDVVFADEPTGNLDGQTAQDIEALLFNLNREQGTTLVLVTHDAALASRCGRRLHLVDGRLAHAGAA